MFFVSGQNISINYPSNVNYGEEFNVDLTLINFSSNIYDIKIYITNSSSNSIAEIWNESEWITSYQYVNNAINTSESNSSTFRLNITKIWNDTANIEVSVRNGATETFSGYTINVNYNPASDPPDEPDIIIDLSYDSEVENGGKFEVDVDLEELQDMNYDIKVYIVDEDNNVISETYNEEDEKWQSSSYYLEEIVSGSGDETVTFELRIDEDYEDFSGDAKIKARVRETESGDIVADFEDDIEILEKENTHSTDAQTILNNQVTNSNQNTNQNANQQVSDSGVIRLNAPAQESIKTKESSLFYKSKLEYIREYGIYGFAFICITIIFILLRKVD